MILVLQAKVAKVQIHGYINTAVVAFTLGGLWAIFQNKENMAASKKQVAKHLTSLHAKVGIAGAALALLAFSTSIYKTYLAKPDGNANYVWCAAYSASRPDVPSSICETQEGQDPPVAGHPCLPHQRSRHPPHRQWPLVSCPRPARCSTSAPIAADGHRRPMTRPAADRGKFNLGRPFAALVSAAIVSTQVLHSPCHHTGVAAAPPHALLRAGPRLRRVPLPVRPPPPFRRPAGRPDAGRPAADATLCAQLGGPRRTGRSGPAALHRTVEQHLLRKTQPQIPAPRRTGGPARFREGRLLRAANGPPPCGTRHG